MSRQRGEFNPAASPHLAYGHVFQERLPLAREADDGHVVLLSGITDLDNRADVVRWLVDHGYFADAGFWVHWAPKLRTDDLVFVSSTVCERVADTLFGPDRPRIERVPFCVDTQLFRPSPDRAKLRRQWANELSAEMAAPLLLTVSSFNRGKNLDQALLLLRQLRSQLSNATLVVVGDPASGRPGYYDWLRGEVSRLALDESVRFTGRLEHPRLAELMSASDALLHLSTCRIENFGLAVAEALAAGLPVMAADWGGFRDLVTDGENGLLAPTTFGSSGPVVHWQGMVDRAAQLLDDAQEWRRVSGAARAFAERHLTYATFRSRLLEVVDRILSEPRPPSQPATLSEAGKQIALTTYLVYREHPDIATTGDEFRRVLAFDGGKTAALVRGPAASRVDLSA